MKRSDDEILESFCSEAYFKCSSCGYGPVEFNHGGDDTHVYHCTDCHEIVNPLIHPFLFVTSDCPLCHRTLRRDERIYTRDMVHGNSIFCPKCNSQTLVLKEVMHIQFGEGDDYGEIPELGQIIHATVCHDTVRSETYHFIRSPRVSVEWRKTLVNAMIADIPAGLHKFRVEYVGFKEFKLSWQGALTNEDGWLEYFSAKS